MTLGFEIDWLEFTYNVPAGLHGLSVWDNFLDEFPEFESLMDEMVLLNKGRHGYTHVFAFTDEFTILYNPENEEMGVHVTFPSHGLYRLMNIFGLNDISEYTDAAKILKILKERNCKISRMDLAYDDYTKTFTPHDFAKWKLEERISTQCRVFGFMSSQASCGGTFYLGKRGRDRFLRIYDKEYESKGAINAIRYEFELRGRVAAHIRDLILDDTDFCIADLIEDMFFITNEYDISGDKDIDYNRKSRAGKDEKWELFIHSLRELFVKQAIVDVKVCTVKKFDSFSKKNEWLTKYMLPTLFIMSEVVGIERFLDMLKSQEGRLKPIQRKMLEKYQAEYNSIQNN